MRRATVLLLFTALAAPASARAAEGDIIVKRDPGLGRAQRAELRERADVRLVDALPVPNTELVAPDGETADALAALRRDPDVVYAEPDRRVHAMATGDTFYSELWGLENTGQTINSYYDDVNLTGQAGYPDADIDAPEAWARTRGAGVTVGVVDTGVDAANPDLAGQVNATLGHDWVDGGPPDDANGHGTHVAGTIAALADNGIGVAGVAPQARIAALRVLDASGSGYSSDVAAAFAYAGALGLRVVNASLGGAGSNAVADAISHAPNTLFVVAAGNDGASNDDPSTADYPCALPYANVICVGASDNRDQPAIFSNFGPVSVDLFAPGVGVASTYMATYAELDGTSMASPHVAGVAALALAANPAISIAQLRAAILGSVDHPAPLAGLSATGGRLNADGAVTAALSATPAPTPTPTPTPTPVPPPPPPPPPPPALTSVSVHGSLRTKKSRLHVRFTLTGTATVRFFVTRASSGTPLTSWRQAGRAGVNDLTLTRRLPSHKTLKRGAYSLVVTLATTAKAARFNVR